MPVSYPQRIEEERRACRVSYLSHIELAIDTKRVSSTVPGVLLVRTNVGTEELIEISSALTSIPYCAKAPKERTSDSNAIAFFM